ncbi:hypothetical protein [Actinomycetospora sp. CA-053990]|uniref:hypothetical protein n=1 Tax=Actinomycetospora sp. CA-053990 TaxID=3239891 RepID=UPI003D907948
MSVDVATLDETIQLTKTTELTKAEAIELARSCGAVVWEGRATVSKFHADDDPERATPYEVIESDPNLLLTAGAGLIWSLVTGGAGTVLNSTNARVCVGDSSTAAAAGQTDLQGTNKFRQLVSGAPSLSTNQAVFTATVATGDANFAWNEAGIANASSGATLLNRFVQSFGTKTSASSWTLAITLSLS